MEKLTLKTNWEKAANDYLEAFCSKHDFDFKDAYWVGDDTGGTACIEDYYFIDMRTIIFDIQLDAPGEEFMKWYDYGAELGALGVERLPDFRQWLQGCPRKTEAEIAELKAAHERVEELKREFEELVDTPNR